MSFALNFYFGGLDTRGYHLVNVAIHVLNGLLVYLLALTLLRLHFASRGAPADFFLPVFLGTTVWLVHPVHTQAVAYIWQRVATLASLFFLASLYAYVEARTRKGDRAAPWLYAAALLFGLLAIGTKENAATLPLFVVLVEMIFLRQERTGRFERRTLVVALVLFAVFAGLTVKFLGPRFVEMMQNEFQRRGFTLTERLLTELRIVIYYFSLLVYPHPSRLMVDYDFRLSRSLFSPWTTFAALLVVAALLAFAIREWRRRPLASFLILWYFGHLVVESSVIPLDLAYEHRLYLPSMAPLVAAVAFAVRRLEQRMSRQPERSASASESRSEREPSAHLRWGWGPSDGKKTGAPRIDKRSRVLALALVLVPLGIASFWSKERTRVWEDPVALWSDNARKAPGKARVHGNLGKAYLDRGDYLLARDAFERAIALDPTLTGAHYNLAVVYLDYLKDVDRAKSILSDLLTREPNYVAARVSKGVIHLRARELPAAKAELEKALEEEPTNPFALFNLGGVYFNLGEMQRAISILRGGVELWPQDARMYALLGAAYFEARALPEAEAALRKALELDPNIEMGRLYWEKLRLRQVPAGPSRP